MLKALSSSLESVLKSQATHARMGGTLANRLVQRSVKNFSRRILGWVYTDAHDIGTLQRFAKNRPADTYVLKLPNSVMQLGIDAQTVVESTWTDLENLLYLNFAVQEDTELVDFLCHSQASTRHPLSDAYEVTAPEAMEVTVERMKMQTVDLNDAEFTISPDVYFAIRQNCKAFKPALTIGHDGYVGLWASGTEKYRVYTDAMRQRAHRVLDSGTIILSRYSPQGQIMSPQVPSVHCTTMGDEARYWTFEFPRLISIDTSSILTTRIYTNDRTDA